MIPAYNEEKRLSSTLSAVLAYADQLARSVEVIVVDDGSRDGTAALVERAAQQDPRLQLRRNPGNRGKGYAVRNGMLAAQGDWVLFSDADMSTPIAEFENLQQAACSQQTQIAIGSRALNRSLIGTRQPAFRENAGKFFNATMRLMTGLPFADTQCGFKLFRRAAAQAVFQRQTLDGFGFDVEVLFIAQQLGFRCAEVPVRWNDVEGTKVSLSNGIDSFLDLLRIRRNSAQGRYR